MNKNKRRMWSWLTISLGFGYIIIQVSLGLLGICEAIVKDQIIIKNFNQLYGWIFATVGIFMIIYTLMSILGVCINKFIEAQKLVK